PGGPLDSTFLPTSLNGYPSSNTANGYAAVSDATCTAHAGVCTRGTLTCDGSNLAYANCKYSSCLKSRAMNWSDAAPETVLNGNNSSSNPYQAGSVVYPATCNRAASNTCSDGSLSSAFKFKNCTVTGQPCTLSANQQGGDCGTGLNDGQTC